MSNIGTSFRLIMVVVVGGLLLALPGFADAQLRLRPRPNPTRPTIPDSTKSSGRDVKGSVAQLLNPQGLAHYHQNPGDLLDLIRQSVDQQRKFPDTALNRSPWGVMHATLAWGPTGDILIDDEPYNAVKALCDNQRLKGVRLLTVKGGLPHPLEGPGLQGHPGQLLAILAQNNVPLEHPLNIGDDVFTVADLVKYEQKTCKPSMELTFKLLGLSHYLPLDETWTAEDGGAWSVERLLRLEQRLPINGQQTCGGLHRLMAIHLATAKRAREGGELGGAWASAAKYTDDYHEYALSLINPDGSCSTEWLERRAAKDDPQRRVQTTGHILEWLAVSLPDDKLRHEKLTGSFAYLAALLMVDIGETWSVGPRAHALRALRIYHDRLASVLPGTPLTIQDRLAAEIDIPSLPHADELATTDTGTAEKGTDTPKGPDEQATAAAGTHTKAAVTEAGTDTKAAAAGTDTKAETGTKAAAAGTDTKAETDTKATAAGTDTKAGTDTVPQATRRQ